MVSNITVLEKVKAIDPLVAVIASRIGKHRMLPMIMEIVKSSVEQIRERFDRDVERFSNLETGQTATMDAALVLDLIAQCVAKTNPQARDILDVGCGAGNYTLKVLSHLPGLNATLMPA